MVKNMLHISRPESQYDGKEELKKIALVWLNDESFELRHAVDSRDSQQMGFPRTQLLNICYILLIWSIVIYKVFILCVCFFVCLFFGLLTDSIIADSNDCIHLEQISCSEVAVSFIQSSGSYMHILRITKK